MINYLLINFIIKSIKLNNHDAITTLSLQDSWWYGRWVCYGLCCWMSTLSCQRHVVFTQIRKTLWWHHASQEKSTYTRRYFNHLFQAVSVCGLDFFPCLIAYLFQSETHKTFSIRSLPEVSQAAFSRSDLDIESHSKTLYSVHCS